MLLLHARMDFLAYLVIAALLLFAMFQWFNKKDYEHKYQQGWDNGYVEGHRKGFNEAVEVNKSN